MKKQTILLLCMVITIQVSARDLHPQYVKVQEKLATGWNTWNTQSVLSHVLLPQGLAINLTFKQNAKAGDRFLREALIGRQGKNMEVVLPGPHAYDGSYTELTMQWRSVYVRVQSATEGDDLVLLVTLLESGDFAPSLIVESGLLWNRAGKVQFRENHLLAVLPAGNIPIYITQPHHADPNVSALHPYYASVLEKSIGISTGEKRTLDEIKEIVRKRKSEHQKKIDSYGELADVYEAVQTVMAWDTIYDPLKNRVISPVSRIWNQWRGGWALFCWDTFFAATMASIDNKELAYANAVEMLQEKSPAGFVPNVSQGNGRKSNDRSQPPVGGITIWQLYEKYQEKWLLEATFDDLLIWNRWWEKNRDYKGLLCWGSDWYDDPWKDKARGNRLAAALESGLDNAPMYDDIPYNSDTHLLELWDVGLNGLYIADCKVLVKIAEILGRTKVANELKIRAKKYEKHLNQLWDKQSGIYLNQRTDTMEKSDKLAPTSFYPMIGKAASKKQVRRMIKEHFYNSDEFWGEWIMPSCARNDSLYHNQNYWQGRIWAPLNYLVYLGLREYSLPQARKDLADKSKNLILKEWLEHRHVHENYNADTGEGCDSRRSDRFYHWGGLLGVIVLMEAGRM